MQMEFLVLSLLHPEVTLVKRFLISGSWSLGKDTLKISSVVQPQPHPQPPAQFSEEQYFSSSVLPHLVSLLSFIHATPDPAWPQPNVLLEYIPLLVLCQMPSPREKG